MADVLTEWPMTIKRRSRQTLYTKFLDGQIYRLVAGVDVPSKNLLAVREGFYSTARAHGKRVHLHVESYDPLTFIVQAVPKT